MRRLLLCLLMLASSACFGNELIVSRDYLEDAVIQDADLLNGAPIDAVALHNVSESLWEVGVGTAILTRGNLSGGPILVERFPNDGTTLVNANQFGFDWAAGPDISAIRRLKSGRFFDAVDFRFFDVQAISGSQFQQLAGTGVLLIRFPVDSGGSLPTSVLTSVASTYGTELYSFEANGRRRIADTNAAWLVGFRWIQLNDVLSLQGPTSANSPFWQWNTNNNLYGCQIGAYVPLIDTNRVVIACSPKAGIYGNQAANAWSNGNAGITNGRNSDFTNQIAFAGDLAVTASYRISKRVAIQGGYQLLWLNGVAVGGDQPTAIDSVGVATGINSGGSAFFHGALASLVIGF